MGGPPLDGDRLLGEVLRDPKARDTSQATLSRFSASKIARTDSRRSVGDRVEMQSTRATVRAMLAWPARGPCTCASRGTTKLVKL